MTRHLLVPGRGIPKPQHWQQQRSTKPGYRSTSLVDAGDAGHLDTAAGSGPWPDGEDLVRRLTTGS